MRFLVDECTGPAVALWLRNQSHEVFSVFEEARGMSDDGILAKAYSEDWILITNDKDLVKWSTAKNDQIMVWYFFVFEMNARCQKLMRLKSYLTDTRINSRTLLWLLLKHKFGSVKCSVHGITQVVISHCPTTGGCSRRCAKPW